LFSQTGVEEAPALGGGRALAGPLRGCSGQGKEETVIRQKGKML
jgi:hypothetical protein